MEFPLRQGMLVAHTAAMTEPRFVQIHREDSDALRHELAQGLLAEPAMVSPKFLYDALGSRLFDAITELPEYTRRAPSARSSMRTRARWPPRRAVAAR
jgi:uncharacterized SAM-dependent methyltransferase